MSLLDFLEGIKTAVSHGKLLTLCQTEPPITKFRAASLHSMFRFLTLFKLTLHKCGFSEAINSRVPLRPLKLQGPSASQAKALLSKQDLI